MEARPVEGSYLDNPGGIITINGISFQFDHQSNYLDTVSSKLTDIYQIQSNALQVIPFCWIDSHAEIKIEILFNSEIKPRYVYSQQLSQRKLIEDGCEGLIYKIKYVGNQVQCLINKYLCCGYLFHKKFLATTISLMVRNDLSTGHYCVEGSKLTIISRMN